MMRYVLLAVLLPALSVDCFGRTQDSQVAGTFVLPASQDDVVRWIRANKSGVFKAANCAVVETRPKEHYLVKTDTPLGACRYVVRLTEKAQKGDVIFQVEYVYNVQGRIMDQRVTISTRGRPGGTEIRVRIFTSFTGSFLVRRPLKSLQNRSVGGIKSFMTKHFPEKKPAVK